MEGKVLSNLKSHHVFRSQKNLWKRNYIWKSESIELKCCVEVWTIHRWLLCREAVVIQKRSKCIWCIGGPPEYVRSACFVLSASPFLLQYLWFVSVGKMLLKGRTGKAELLQRIACWTWNCFAWLNNNNFSYFKQRFFFQDPKLPSSVWHNTKPWWSPKWWLTMWGKCMGILTNQGIY